MLNNYHHQDLKSDTAVFKKKKKKSTVEKLAILSI